jgi:hypothetical protein
VFFAPFVLAVGLTLAIADARATGTLPAADRAAIRQVISLQREALIAGDAARAFAFATPALRRQFGNATAFMRMVREGYADLLEADETEFLEAAIIDGAVVQPLRLVLADGRVRVALYTLERQRDARWRIAGCLIAPSTIIRA